MERKPKIEASILAAIEKRAQSYKIQIEENNKKLNNLQALFSKDIGELTNADLAEQPLSKINRIIEAIEMTNEDFGQIKLDTDGGREYLLLQIKEFIKVHRDNRIDHAMRGIARCEKYVDFINAKKLKEVIDDKDFNNFFNTLGISDAEKLYVNRMLAEKNIAAVKVDPELTQTVVYLDSYQKGNDDIKEEILNQLGEKPRRLVMTSFKDLCRQVSKICHHSVELVENVLVSMLIEQEYGKYLTSGRSEHLKKINSVMPYSHEDKQVVMAEANRIISIEMVGIRHPEFESFEEIIVTDAETEEEFLHRQAMKKAMIATVLKDKVEKYYNNRTGENDRQYKDIIMGLCDEYRKTEALSFVQSRGRAR